MSEYEAYIETSEGIQRLTSPPLKPPRVSVGPVGETKETPKKKGGKKNDDTDQA